MTRYHESPTSGQMEVCPATIRCTLGGNTLHVEADTPQQAQTLHEQALEQEYGGMTPTPQPPTNTTETEETPDTLTEPTGPGYAPPSPTDKEFPYTNIWGTRKPDYPEGFEKPAYERLASKADYLATVFTEKARETLMTNEQQAKEFTNTILKESGLGNEYYRLNVVKQLSPFTLGIGVDQYGLVTTNKRELARKILGSHRHFPQPYDPMGADETRRYMNQREQYIAEQAQREDEEEYRRNPGAIIGDDYVAKYRGGAVIDGELSRYNPRPFTPTDMLQEYNDTIPEKHADLRLTSEDLQYHRQNRTSWETAAGIIAAHSNTMFNREQSIPRHPGGRFDNQDSFQFHRGNTVAAYEDYTAWLREQEQGTENNVPPPVSQGDDVLF